MADTPAERKRRSRLHKAGEHSLCDEARCREPRAELAGHGGGHVTESGHDGTVSAALAAFLDAATGGLAADDPKQVSAAIARTMAERIDAGDMHGMVGQLRQVVKDLGAEPGRPGDRLDAVIATRQQRRLDSLLSQAEARARRDAEDQP